MHSGWLRVKVLVLICGKGGIVMMTSACIPMLLLDLCFCCLSVGKFKGITSVNEELI